jgi:hypothetical protein
MPDDHEDGAGDRDKGLELAPAPGDPPVPLAKKGIGLGGPRHARLLRILIPGKMSMLYAVLPACRPGQPSVVMTVSGLPLLSAEVPD